jgi:hypothetical protein
LKNLLEQSLQTPEQQAWLHKFVGFDFTIEYKPGKENVAVDALSRSQLLQELKQELLQQQEWREILQNRSQDTEPKLPYVVQGGLILFKYRLLVPTNSPLIAKILKEYHSSPIGGHAGVTRTLARVQAQFYWSKMKQDVKDFVAKCTICQQAKSLNTTPMGLLQPLPIPQQVWEDIAMDFITGLPNSFGFTVIMVVIDRLTKYSHFIA